MFGKKTGVLCAVAALGAAGSMASAAPLLLGFNSGATNAVVLNNGALSATDVPVTITFNADNTYPGSSSPVSGTFSLSATAATPGAAGSISPPGFYFEQFTNVSFSIVDNASNVILSGTAASGSLSGGSASFAFNASDASAGIALSSTYFNVAGSSDASYAFAFGGVDHPSITGGHLDNFTATLGGGALSASVPEPSSLGLAGLAGLALLARRGRRRIA